MFGKIGIFGLVLVAMMQPAKADNYPSKPIRIVIGFAPGGGTDLLARVLADKMGSLLKTTIVVDNKPGASGTLGAGEVARAAPDGYTVLLGTQGMISSAPYAQKPMPYDPLTDFQAISLLGTSQLQIYVNNDFPAKTFAEFINLIRANPGKYPYATSGIMGPGHMFAELLSRNLDLRMKHVPYAGDGKAINDVLGGIVPIWSSGPAAFPLAKEGKVRPLVTSGEQRMEGLPDTPTSTELGYPKAATIYYNVLLAPKGTPIEIAELLHQALVEVYKDKGVVDRIKMSGLTPATMPPAAMTEYIKKDVELWKEIVADLISK